MHTLKRKATTAAATRVLGVSGSALLTGTALAGGDDRWCDTPTQRQGNRWKQCEQRVRQH